VKRFKTGLTMVELLTVVAIMALLIGILLPSVTAVRRAAKEAKQHVQITTIELALTAFKNDYGDYPPSDPCSHNTEVNNYCGAQKLVEALLGRDLLGFNKYSNWSATDPTYYPTEQGALELSLYDRMDPYLELATADVFRLGGLFTNIGVLSDRFVLCDVFHVKKIIVVNQVTGKSTYYNAGTPILYFKANTTGKTIIDIYHYEDNEELIKLGPLKGQPPHFPVGTGQPGSRNNFLEYIIDPKVSTGTLYWPYRPDSYILISAGADGLYGTADDITNF